jgi:F0F1-type ATP synthase assembly protein I
MIAGFVLIVLMTKDMKSGFSALTGGLAYWLPTFIFTRSVAACAGARMAGRFMVAFFGGEVFKLALSGALFLFAVSYLHVQLMDAVIGLVVAIVSFWVAAFACLYRSGAVL